MANYSKIIYAGKTLIDLTQDTVVADKMLEGYTAHDKSGAIITGTCTFDADTRDANVMPAEMLVGKTAYKNGAKVEGTMPNIGAVDGKISAKDEQYTVPAGYHDGSGVVSIADAEKAKLIAENIREGVTVLGVTGSMTGTEDAVAEQVSVTPSTEEQVILPNAEEGYNYIAQVTVAPIPYNEVTNEAGGLTVTIG